MRTLADSHIEICASYAELLMSVPPPTILAAG